MARNLYSLWLIPAGESHKILSGEIKRLSKKYRTPSFDPHITLLTDIEEEKNDVLLRTSELAKHTRSFLIKFGKIGYAQEYLRALFLEVEQSREIMYLNAAVRKLFGRESDPPYFPHLSLIYGDFSNSLKEKIIKEIKLKRDLAFVVKSMSVYSSAPEVRRWKKIGSFIFKA